MKKLKNATSQTGFLDSRDNLFSMLVIAARQNNGELRFAMDDIVNVRECDGMGVLFDKKSKELIVRLIETGISSNGAFLTH